VTDVLCVIRLKYCGITCCYFLIILLCILCRICLIWLFFESTYVRLQHSSQEPRQKISHVLDVCRYHRRKAQRISTNSTRAVCQDCMAVRTRTILSAQCHSCSNEFIGVVEAVIWLLLCVNCNYIYRVRLKTARRLNCDFSDVMPA